MMNFAVKSGEALRPHPAVDIMALPWEGLRLPRIWGIVRIREKIVRDAVVALDEGTLDNALEALCLRLDVPRPVVLKKHYSEFQKFFRTRFTPDDFIERVSFATFEVEVLREKKKNEGLREEYL
jgi:hypothetical protein